MDSSKIISMISLCRRAGKLSMGFDMVKESCKAGKTKCIMLTSDLSPKSDERITAIATNKKVSVIRLGVDMMALSQVTGKQTGIIGIDDMGFAAKLMELTGCTSEEENCL